MKPSYCISCGDILDTKLDGITCVSFFCCFCLELLKQGESVGECGSSVEIAVCAKCDGMHCCRFSSKAQSLIRKGFNTLPVERARDLVRDGEERARSIIHQLRRFSII